MPKYFSNSRKYQDLEIQFNDGQWKIFLESRDEWVNLQDTNELEGKLYKKKTREFKTIPIKNGIPVFPTKDKSINALCYNCGKKMDDTEVTAEHIPAKNLFDGFPDEYKNNRVTVTGCQKCNGEYSIHDEEFRNVFGVISESKTEEGIVRKTEKSLKRKKAVEKGRVFIGKDQKVSGVSFDEEHFLKIHEKNFRGLFKEKFNAILPDDFEVLVDLMDLEVEEFNNRGIVENYLTQNFEWEYSGHPDVFSYIIQPYSAKLPGDYSDIPFSGEENFYLALMIYRDRIAAMVAATNDQGMKKKLSKMRK